VIRHEVLRPQPKAMANRILAEQFQVEMPVLGFQEYIGSPISALCDVMRKTKYGNTRASHKISGEIRPRFEDGAKGIVMLLPGQRMRGDFLNWNIRLLAL